MIYISGPITGVDNYQMNFFIAEQRLKKRLKRIINPAKLQDCLPELTHSEYMTICMAELSLCDSIYMLKGYEKSKGAMQELKWAEENGLKIIKEK